jgi:hypothetical protein
LICQQGSNWLERAPDQGKGRTKCWGNFLSIRIVNAQNVETEHKYPTLHQQQDQCKQVNTGYETVSQDNSVSIVTDTRAGRSGFDSWQGQWFYLFAIAFGPPIGPTQPPIKWVLRAFSPGVRQAAREANQSHSSSAVVNTWSYISTPPYVFMA